MGSTIKIIVFAVLALIFMSIVIAIMTGKEKPLQKSIRNTGNFVKFVNETYKEGDELPFDQATLATRKAAAEIIDEYRAIIDGQKACVYIPNADGLNLHFNAVSYDDRQSNLFIEGRLQGTIVASENQSLTNNAKFCVVTIDFGDNWTTRLTSVDQASPRAQYLDPDMTVKQAVDGGIIMYDPSIFFKHTVANREYYCIPRYTVSGDWYKTGIFRLSDAGEKIADMQLRARSLIKNQLLGGEMCAP